MVDCVTQFMIHSFFITQMNLRCLLIAERIRFSFSGTLSQSRITPIINAVNSVLIDLVAHTIYKIEAKK